jgi:hypothetical protein
VKPAVPCIKEYDGSDSAFIRVDSLHNVLSGDSIVIISAYVSYENARVGKNKVVIAHYTVGGDMAKLRYYVISWQDTVCFNGEIIIPNPNNPDSSAFWDCPTGGGCDNDNDGIPNINDPDADNFQKVGGGGDTTHCGKDIPNINCPYYPYYDSIGGGGDTSYCGHNIQNIDCPDFPGYYYPGGGHDLNPNIVVIYADSTFKVAPAAGFVVPVGDTAQWLCLTYKRPYMVADVTPLVRDTGMVHIEHVGNSYILGYVPKKTGEKYSRVVMRAPIQVNKRQLYISTPTLTTAKAYDRTDTVVGKVTPGRLSNLSGADTSYQDNKPHENLWVEVEKIGYDSAEVGVNRKIAVEYYLRGNFYQKTYNGTTYSYHYSDNYITPKDDTLAGEIYRRPLWVEVKPAVPCIKEYDGSNSASIHVDSLHNVLSGDSIVITSAYVSYENAQVGKNKVVIAHYTVGGDMAKLRYYVISWQDTVCLNGEIIIPNPNNPDSSAFWDCPTGGGCDNDNDGIPNIIDPNTDNFHELGGGGDTSHCGASILNIYCPDYPYYDNQNVDTNIIITYGAAPFWINSPAVDNAVGDLTWRSFGPEVAEVGSDDGVININGVGVAHILCTVTDNGRRSLLLRVRVEVKPKQLTVAGTWVDTVKASDGNRNAAVLLGNLRELLPVDIGSVTVSATATYNNNAIGNNKIITVTYQLDGDRAYCYVEPPHETHTGRIVPTGSSISDIWGMVMKLEDIDSAYAPWPDMHIAYTINGIRSGELMTDVNGRYFLSGLGEDDTVELRAPQKYGYTCAPQQQLVGATLQLVQADTIFYTSDDGSDTTYCGGGILNIYCPNYPDYDDRNVDTSFTVTYGEAPFRINSPAVENAVETLIWRSFEPEVALVDDSGKIALTGVGVVHLLCTVTDDKGQSSLLLSVLIEVEPKPITIAGVSVSVETIKVYDGSDTAHVTFAGNLSGIVPTDTLEVALRITAHYLANPGYKPQDTGMHKQIVLTYELTGEKKKEYLLSTLPDTIDGGAITPRQLQITATLVDTAKIYDGNDSVHVRSPGTFLNKVEGDTVYLSATARYDNPELGMGKTIVVTYSISGNDTYNYLAPKNDSIFTGSILDSTAALRPITGATFVAEKIYDGSDTAHVTFAGNLFGVFPADTLEVALHTTARYLANPGFKPQDTGTHKQVVLSYRLVGPKAPFYLLLKSLDTVAGGVITPRPLEVTGTIVDTAKAYDGSDSAHVRSPGTFLNKVEGDAVYLSATARYDSAAVGTGKTIAITYAISGNSAYNYLAPKNDTVTTGEITRRQLWVQVDVTRVKEYDDATTADVSIISVDAVIPGDNVTVLAEGHYDNISVGENKRIVIHYTLSGPDSGSYFIYPDSVEVYDGEIVIPAYNNPDSMEAFRECEAPVVAHTGQTVYGGLCDDDGDSIPNINDANAPNYYLPGGGGDTSYCGGGILNIYCPKYPGYDQLGGGGDTSDDPTSMIALEIIDNNGDTLASWTRENIRDTIYYALPCDENSDRIVIAYTPSQDVEADEHYVIVKEYITPIDDGNFSVNMGSYGGKSVTIVLDDGQTRNEYTVVLERRVLLFNVITEHLDGIRLVHNNPETNATSLTFSTCAWYRKQGADTAWALVGTNIFYYLAGESIKDKFATNDSMYLILYTTEGVRVVTCPGASNSTYISTPTPGGATFGQKSGEETVYPNPVSTGGSIHLKPKLLKDGEEERYTYFYLYNIQGTLMSSGSAAPLYQGEGLTMPDAPGIYHLILENESKKKWVRIAVGN